MVPAPTWQGVLAVPATGGTVALPVTRTSMTVTPVSLGEPLRGAALGNMFVKSCYLPATVLSLHLHSALTFPILLMELRSKEVQ